MSAVDEGRTALTGDDLILQSCTSVLPMSFGIDLAPDGAMVASVRSSFVEFPRVVCFSEATPGSVEVDRVSLLPWRRVPLVLQARVLGGRTDLASVGDLLGLVIIPSCVDIEIALRVVDGAPRRVACVIMSRNSVVQRRRDLLLNCDRDRRPLGYASWWREDHQRLVDLPEEEARRLDADIALCSDGTPRRDLRVAMAPSERS